MTGAQVKYFPDGSQEQMPPMLFLPVGKLGYAFYSEEGDTFYVEEREVHSRFEFDAAVTEELSSHGKLSFLDELEARCSPLLTDGRCRCQFCMPDFDPAAVTKAVTIPE